MAANQALDENFRALYLDFEQTVDLDYFKAIGVNTDKPHFILSQPTTMEEGALIAKLLLSADLIDAVVWDTPGASQPAAIVNSPITEKELREGMRDVEAGKSSNPIGLHARCFAGILAFLVPLLADKGAVLIVPNQIRVTINTWGAGETTPGGNSLKFHASQRVRLSKTETIKEKVVDDYLGTSTSEAVENLVQFHAIKNKTAPPFRKAKVRLRYGEGFLDLETLIDLAIRRNIVKKAGGGNFTAHDGTAMRGTELIVDFYRDRAKYDQLRAALADTKASPGEVEEVVEELDEGKVAL